MFLLFSYQGDNTRPHPDGHPPNLEGEFTQAVKWQRTEEVLYQKKERVRSLLSEIINTTKNS